MTPTTDTPDPRQLLSQACSAAGLSVEGAEPIRLAENQIWRLPKHQVIVRVSRPGQTAAARREVRVARWLAEHGMPAVRLAEDLDEQLVETDGGHPVTFWTELPPHEHGSSTDVAQLLCQLHALPLPDFELGTVDPFVRIPERLQAATTLDEGDRAWLHGLHQDLAAAWAERPEGRPLCAVHGDAWPGNLVRTAHGPVMMDLERFSLGPPEWDLVSTAVGRRTTGSVSDADYEQFCSTYGFDVTEWPGYAVLAGARELRMVTYAAQHAASNPEWAQQAQLRVDCLRGRRGPRPWNWKGIM
jgi:aminoglycoside phosphotransferase (APT) family kinase protein